MYIYTENIKIFIICATILNEYIYIYTYIYIHILTHTYGKVNERSLKMFHKIIHNSIIEQVLKFDEG